MTDYEPFLTPPEIARFLRVSQQKVLTWIRKGALAAINVSNAHRPRYRISRESLDSFLQARSVVPPAPQPRGAKRPPAGGPIDPELGKKLAKLGQAVLEGKTYYRVWNGVTLFF